MTLRTFFNAAALSLLALLLALPAAAQARTVLDLDTRAQPVALNDWGDYWIDKTGRLSAEEVANTPNLPWQPTSASQVFPITQGQTAWISIHVPPAPDSERWYLEVPQPAIDRASLYTLDGAGRWNEQRAGDLVPVADWPVPHRYPLLPITLSAEVPTTYLLRLENAHPTGMPLRFVSEGRISASEQSVSLVLGIFFGLAGLAAVVSALSAVSLRDTTYGWYATLVTLLGLTQTTFIGVGGLHLWPHWARFNDLSGFVIPMLASAAAMLTVSVAVNLSERSPPLAWLMKAGAVFGLIAAALLLVVPANLRPTLLVPATVLLLLLAAGVLAWAWRRGDRFAPWLLVAFIPVALASCWTLAPLFGWLPVGFAALHGMQIALAVHLPVVLVALMLRSQDRRENNRRIQGLDRVDPATGLINGHVFAERLTRMMARSMRLRQHGAVMLIDLMNYEQIQRDFGRKAAEEMPLRVAERLLSTAREIDSAARLDDRRFGMLVEGPFTPEEAAAMGPRIVARCLMPFPGLHVECVAQIRIAHAQVPFETLDAANLIARLTERLAAAPLSSKRAVFMLSAGMPPQMPNVPQAGESFPTPLNPASAAKLAREFDFEQT